MMLVRIAVPAVLIMSMQLLSFDCGIPVIGRYEKASDIEKKMKCFAEENVKLKQDMAKMQSTNGNIKLRWAVRRYNPTKFPLDTCKSKSISTILARSGTLLGQGSDWMDFQVGSTAISVICEKTSADTAYIIGAGTQQQPMFDLVELLLHEIF